MDILAKIKLAEQEVMAHLESLKGEEIAVGSELLIKDVLFRLSMNDPYQSMICLCMIWVHSHNDIIVEWFKGLSSNATDNMNQWCVSTTMMILEELELLYLEEPEDDQGWEGAIFRVFERRSEIECVKIMWEHLGLPCHMTSFLDDFDRFAKKNKIHGLRVVDGSLSTLPARY